VLDPVLGEWYFVLRLLDIEGERVNFLRRFSWNICCLQIISDLII